MKLKTAANAWLATDLDDFLALAEVPELGLANRCFRPCDAHIVHTPIKEATRKGAEQTETHAVPTDPSESVSDNGELAGSVEVADPAQGPQPISIPQPRLGSWVARGSTAQA